MLEDIVHCLAGQKRFEDDSKEPDLLPNVNKADMAKIIEAIKKFLRLCVGAVKAPLAYITKETTIVHTYGDYPKYMTPDDKMIASVLHIPPEKNNLLLEHNVHSVKEQSMIGSGLQGYRSVTMFQTA